MTRPKVKKVPTKSPMHEKITEAWYKHPIAIATAFATFIGAVASAVPMARWILDHVDAKSVEAKLNAHKEADLKDGLWRDVQDAKVNLGLVEFSVVALRNRVNDCNISRDKREIKTIREMNACQQYSDELSSAQMKFTDASKKLDQAREKAKEASKEK